MTELARRCEETEGPSYALEHSIYKTVNPDGYQRRVDTLLAGPMGPRLSPVDYDGYIVPPAYTSSLDAAMALVPEGWLWQVELIGHQTKGRIGAAMVWLKHRQVKHGKAATPALALCATALRAGGENG